MFSNIETLLIYNLLLFVIVILSKKHNKIFVFISYFLIFLFTSFRYDIGYDYENYARAIMQISKSLNYLDPSTIIVLTGKEPMLALLVLLLGKIEHLFVVVFSIYSLVFTYFIYKAFETYKIHTQGILLLFVLTILFQSWDWMRQGVSLSIFLFSLKYIKRRRFKQYLLCILFAALWHFSAIIMLLAYPLARIKIPDNKNRILCILIIVFGLAELQVFSSLYEIVLKYIPYYNEIYVDSEYSTFEEFKFYSLPFIMYSIWYIIIVYNGVKNNTPYVMILFVGVILFMISGGNLLVDRIAWYFTGTQLLVVPIYCKSKIFSLGKVLICLLIFSHYLYFNRQILNGGLRGSSQYITVFSNNYEHRIFNKR